MWNPHIEHCAHHFEYYLINLYDTFPGERPKNWTYSSPQTETTSKQGTKQSKSEYMTIYSLNNASILMLKFI